MRRAQAHKGMHTPRMGFITPADAVRRVLEGGWSFSDSSVNIA